MPSQGIPHDFAALAFGSATDHIQHLLQFAIQPHSHPAFHAARYSRSEISRMPSYCFNLSIALSPVTMQSA